MTGKAAAPPPGDSVALLMDQWARERPDLGARVPSIVARILRLASHFRKRADQWQPLGMSWEVAEIIIALRRSGPPFQMTPTALYKSMLLTSGAMTNRLDRVAAAGFIERFDDPDDRRSIVVRLTPEGVAIADEAISRYYVEMEKILDALSRTDADRLAELLALLLSSVENAPAAQDDAPLAPAAKRRRRAAPT